MTWFVYILRCADDTFYTGITTDVTRRVNEHNQGKKSANYTRQRRPVELIYSEPAQNRSKASMREYAIKQLNREDKRLLIDQK